MPSLAFAPALLRRPPITKVGSSPASANTLATRLVVVVLPCVPAMATPCFMRISSASMTARGTMGMWRSRAASTSGLSALTAVEVTTASASWTLSAECPTCVAMPKAARRRSVALSDKSEPEIW